MILHSASCKPDDQQREADAKAYREIEKDIVCSSVEHGSDQL
jgi:hypothetical protein